MSDKQFCPVCGKENKITNSVNPAELKCPKLMKKRMKWLKQKK